MIRVLVADDHAVLRAGAKEIVLRGFQDAICGEAANGEQVLL
jgi:DNA-binding NarL/FixJ family response regulator